MSKLPKKPPFESLLSRKRNIHPSPSKSSRSTHSINSLTASPMTIPNASSTDDLIEHTTDTDDPRVGDRVLVDAKQIYGTLRFLGPTEFKSGIWAGIELDHQGTGKNDGSVKGIHYFTCASNTGIFVLSSKITLVSRNSSIITRRKNPRVNTSTSLSSSYPSPSSQSRPASASLSVSSSISASPLSATTTLSSSSPSSGFRRQPYCTNKYSQRTVFNNNVTPIPSIAAAEHVGHQRTQHPVRSSQSDELQQFPPPPPLQNQRQLIDDSTDQQHPMAIMDHQRQEINSYQVKLGREQHRVYELRKEREHLVQQVQQSNQQLTQQHQVMQQWQAAQDRIQDLETLQQFQATKVNELNQALEQAQAMHRKESAQLLEQQSQLIQELQRERQQHDSLQSRLRHVEQACQSLMDPFDVRPGLDIVDQLKETQRQVKDLLEKARDDTDQKNQQRRDIIALHRDVTHLESLIETKFFKEADLMSAMELEQQQNRQLRHELALLKSASNNISTNSLPIMTCHRQQQRRRRRKSSGKPAATATEPSVSSAITTSVAATKRATNRSSTSAKSKKQHPISVDSGVVLAMDDPRWTSGSGETIATCTASLSGGDDDDEEDDDDDDDEEDDDDSHPAYCEICDTVGHDLMTCAHVAMDLPVKTKTKYSSIPLEPHMESSPILQHKIIPSL